MRGEVSVSSSPFCGDFFENFALSFVDTRYMSVDFVPCRLSKVSSMNRSTKTAAKKYNPAISKLGNKYG
jgi:hypothetical protein